MAAHPFHGPCDTSLYLGMVVGRSDSASRARLTPPPPVQLELLPLRPISSSSPHHHASLPWLHPAIDMNQAPPAEDMAECSRSAFSSFHSDPAPSATPLKRAAEKPCETDQERTCEVNSSRASDEDEAGQARKKLRLTKEQSALLEESFKQHSTLNPKQKNALARQLNLRPRQVEVWFQNRRARTKLKQTEVDCEFLKRCCETLAEENRRLQREVQELRAIKVAPPCVIAHDLYMPLPAATLTMCPSCERLAAATSDNSTTLAFPTLHLPHFPQPSAAC